MGFSLQLTKTNLSGVSFTDSAKFKPSKHALNIVVGFDTVYKEVRILRMFGLAYDKAVVQNFPYSNQFLSEEFLDEFKKIFEEYFKSLPTKNSLACFMVMPDNCIAMDDISVPNMSNTKLKAALHSTLLNQYKQFKELQFNAYMMSSNRQYVNFNITILRKSYLTNLYRCMASHRLYTKNSSYSANCLVNSCLQFIPSVRKKSFIMMDVKADYTKVVVAIHGRTAGFTLFKLGTVHLKDDKVLQENMQYEHDVADLAIINAKEKAKMKQLTLSDMPDDLADVADDVQEQLIAGVNKNEDGTPADTTVADEIKEQNATVSEVLKDTESQKPEGDSLASAAEDIAMTTEEQSEADEFDREQEEEERKERLMQQMLEARKKKVFARKMPKRLPKFMLRPVPEDREGIIYENFRMLVKWALLYNSHLKKQEFLPKIDFVLVNMPAEYDFLYDMVNSEDENNEVPFKKADFNLPDNVKGNLDLVGALFTGMFNRRQNF